MSSSNVWLIPGEDLGVSGYTTNAGNWSYAYAGTDGQSNGWGFFPNVLSNPPSGAGGVTVGKTNVWGNDWASKLTTAPSVVDLTNFTSDQLVRQGFNGLLRQGAEAEMVQRTQLVSMVQGQIDLSNLIRTQTVETVGRSVALTNLAVQQLASAEALRLLTSTNLATQAALSAIVFSNLPAMRVSTDQYAAGVSNLYVQAAIQLAGQTNANALASLTVAGVSNQTFQAAAAASNTVASVQGVSNAVAALASAVATNNARTVEGETYSQPTGVWAMPTIPEYPSPWVQSMSEMLRSKLPLPIVPAAQAPLVTMPFGQIAGLSDYPVDFGAVTGTQGLLGDWAAKLRAMLLVMLLVWACFAAMAILRTVAPD